MTCRVPKPSGQFLRAQVGGGQVKIICTNLCRIFQRSFSAVVRREFSLLAV